MSETAEDIEAEEKRVRRYAEEVLPAEVAAEMLNSVMAHIMARVYAAEKTDEAEAERLFAIKLKLAEQRNKIRCENPEYNNALADKWGRLLKDKKALWAELNRLDNAPAEAAAQAARPGAA